MRVVRNRRKKGTDEKGHESARGVRGGRAKEDRMLKRKGRERERNIYIQPPVSFII